MRAIAVVVLACLAIGTYGKSLDRVMEELRDFLKEEVRQQGPPQCEDADDAGNQLPPGCGTAEKPCKCTCVQDGDDFDWLTPTNEECLDQFCGKLNDGYDGVNGLITIDLPRSKDDDSSDTDKRDGGDKPKIVKFLDKAAEKHGGTFKVKAEISGNLFTELETKCGLPLPEQP